VAVYISIRKINDSETDADYTFSLVDRTSGSLRINKATGDVKLLEPLPGDNEERLFARAAHKVRQHWSKGEFPESTSWAS
jgi:hypothetical protein